MFGTVEERVYPLVGIVENVVIDKIEYVTGTSEAGNAYEAISIFYKQPNGSTVNAWYFPPKDWGDAEQFKKDQDRFNRAFQQMAVAIGNKEDYAAAIGQNADFKSFADKAIAYINANKTGKMLRVKFIYKKRNIQPATANPVRPTFESMSIPSTETRMNIDPEFDRLEPAPEKVDNEDAAQMMDSGSTDATTDTSSDWMDS